MMPRSYTTGSTVRGIPNEWRLRAVEAVAYVSPTTIGGQVPALVELRYTEVSVKLLLSSRLMREKRERAECI